MYFSAPKVYTMPGFKTNVKDCQAITKTIKQKAFKVKAQDVIDLYVAKQNQKQQNGKKRHTHDKPTTFPTIWSGRGRVSEGSEEIPRCWANDWKTRTRDTKEAGKDLFRYDDAL